MNDHHIRQLATREISAGFNRSFQRANNVCNFYVDNLDLEHTLVGHEGCVNCLDWNDTGTILASGSDDTKVILWDFHGYKILKKLNTLHRGNIFSVKFLPGRDNIIVTGAADGGIFVHDVAETLPIGSSTVEGRVKRIVNDKSDPHIFISASEDGSVTQYDIRSNLHDDRKILLNLADANNIALECKCLAISPTNPHNLAIGCSDSVIRLYDRRKMNDSSEVMIFTPGHIPSSKSARDYATTYLVFNASGNELLANIGNEHIYLFDINDKTKSFALPRIQPNNNAHHENEPHSGTTSGQSTSQSSAPHHYTQADTPPFKRSRGSFHTIGNRFYDEKKYSSAINMYNKALLKTKNPLLLSNRAAALIKRNWTGDHYAALKDCCSALNINPGMVKAHYRLARCLLCLEHVTEAKLYLDEFKMIHPEHSKSPAFLSLENAVEKASKDSSNNEPNLSKDDRMRGNAFDYKYRYLGHCNATTDIKEANFFGENGQFIVAGSDEGTFYVWERESTNLVRVMQADSSVVNCLQPHPSSGILATSGLDNEVKLWSPKFSDHQSRFVIENVEALVEKNQRIMATAPYDAVFGPFNMHIRAFGSDGQAAGCRQF